MVNSRLGLFTATTLPWHPFFRSYGVNMPSSLTTLLPMALGSSPHLPVSVCGTGARLHPVYLFSPPAPFASLLEFQSLSTGSTSARLKVCIRVSILKCVRLRNLYRMCIDYAFRPRLSPRLTRGGRTAYPGRTNLPPETLDFRPLRFSRNSRYSFRHSHLCKVHASFR